METLILDGRKASQSIREKLKKEVEKLKERGIQPKVTFISVGKNPSMESYERAKENACNNIGIETENINLASQTTTQELIEVIERKNEDQKINGILVQLPLPPHVDRDRVLFSISLQKDVDCLNITNMGYLLFSEPLFFPNTPMGILELLKFYNINVNGKHVVILGRGKTVGLPLANILLRKKENGNATVTVCHTKTKDIKAFTLSADVLVTAMGRPKFIDRDFIREGTVVVDAGINYISTNEGIKLVGDVDFDSVIGKASAVSPVPGGVGPMTVTMLLKNIVKASKEYGC